MTTIDDILVLIEKGLYEDALLKVSELDDNLEKVRALSLIALDIYEKFSDVSLALELMEDAEYFAKKIKDPFDRVVALSSIASTYLTIGDKEKGVKLFEKALDEALDIEDSGKRVIALGKTSYYMAISGFVDSALEAFDVAFDTLIRSKMDYTQKTDYLIKLGELLEATGDSLHSNDALSFYERAYDLFDKLHVNIKAAVLEKKIALAKTMKKTGSPELRKALLEGRYNYAIAKITNLFRGEEQIIGLLEVALWMKRVETSEYKQLIREVLEKMNAVDFSQDGIGYIATLLTELGSIREALVFASKIADIKKKSEALKAIALELAREKELEDAYRELLKQFQMGRLKRKPFKS
ncbi:hypothetical protein [Thermococcus sp. LS2]|uniref:hypothetical protein n=1 Tax=Thermococcus sp. LS2 TaxID=1638260 RepID=UPI001438FF31|nr:hypothetical protein [Thermococcus sp. LS2]NJE11803.1 hypothetical protein [Thermococcus sp. LS2]